MASANDNPVWFITGCSTGFGRELGKAVIARGWRVMLTARDPASVKDLVALAPDRAAAETLDVKNPEHITAAVAAAEKKFGAIDVLVNNAGYGYVASVEEGEDAGIRDLFETNFFGLVRVTQTVLPIMRRQRRGHIINIGSVAGIIGGAGSGFYSATKHALEGLTESLAAEVDSFGIKATVVEPGPFRTDFGSRSFKATQPKIPDYVNTLGVLFKLFAQRSGTQRGDPARAADAIIEAYLSPKPPLHLPLGPDTLDRIEAKFANRLAELNEWRALGRATNFANE